MWVELLDGENTVYWKKLGGRKQEELQIGTKDRRIIEYFRLKTENPESILQLNMKETLSKKPTRPLDTHLASYKPTLET